MDISKIRCVFLDTETTGKAASGPAHVGHRVIEIGAVEVDCRNFTGREYRQFLNPGMKIDPEAIAVHGITDEFVADKPEFREVAGDFIDFIRDAVLIIHNAKFDVGFLDQELSLAGITEPLNKFCKEIVDSYSESRRLSPGHAKYSLDALCDFFHIDNSGRTQHGALLDARLLAEVYLAMTGGQKSMSFDKEPEGILSPVPIAHGPLKVIHPTEAELKAHMDRLGEMESKDHRKANWLTYWE